MSGQSREDNVLRLRDGRMLGYAEAGDPAGAPLMFFHGLPGSRINARLGEEPGRRCGVRIIAPERPGFGLSSPQKGRRMLRWPRDVIELADALGINRFAVAGVSGGGPYAAACAYAIPERLTGVGIVSGVGPADMPGFADGMMRTNQLLFAAARRVGPVASVMMWVMSQAARRPERFMGAMERQLPPDDRRIVQRPEVKDMFAADVREAFRQGSGGAAVDTRLFARPWGFDLREIQTHVDLWQGEDDRNVPVAHGRYQASQIPDCTARLLPGEGHLLVVDRLEEIMTAVVGVPAPA